MITFVFAGFFGLFFMLLTAKTIITRRKVKIAVGIDGNETLARISRAHGNFAEYAPLALLFSYFCETSGYDKYLLSILLTSLFIGRICHFYGVTIAEPKNKIIKFRIIGMAITITVISIFSLMLIFS